MDVTSALILIVFVVLGGVIAVVADELGRRIGKKRLVLHRRIRPRTTARIITFAAGVTITILTIALMYASSVYVREWVREGSRAFARLRSLQTEARDLAASNQKLRTENATLNADNRRVTEASEVLRSKFADLQKKTKVLQSKTQELSLKLAGFEQKLPLLNRQIAEKVHAITLKERSISTLEANLKTERASYQRLQATYGELSKQKTELGQQNLDLDHKLKDAEDRLKATQSLLEDGNKKIADANTEISGLSADVQSLSQQKSQAQSDLDDLSAQLSDAKVRLTQYEQDLENNAKRVRFVPLMFSLGEELARVSIPAESSKADIAEQIESAILLAGTTAKAHGARPADSGAYTILATALDKQGQPLSADAQKDLLAAQLAGSKSETALLVLSAYNAFDGEPVYVHLAPVADPIVYEPNQVIAEIRVNARDGANVLLQELNDLGTKIRNAALKKKMIPVQTGDRSLGTVTSDDIIVLYDKIKSSTGSVKVQARARRLTRAADPLLIDFEVQ